MAKRKKSEIHPIVSSSHISEDDSKLLFAQTIKPWIIINWFQKDYGIDASIEISRFLVSEEEQIATGKRFSLQLKSSKTNGFDKESLKLYVLRDKIIYWHNAIEPVMLAYADLQSNKIYYRWVDEDLIREIQDRNPDWLSQENVSVIFNKNNIIDAQSLKEIERNVFSWKRPMKTILTPGNYFRYSQQAAAICNKLLTAVNSADIEMLKDELNSLMVEIPKSIYTITIVGPNRVGKSTLINSMLNKYISPVDELPTTGIPISFFPSNENKTTISFQDKDSITGGIDETFIRQYTSQQENPKNQKRVKYVSVNIVNHMLEKGLALCDVPGLNDANEEIRRITKAAIFSGNAIVYVISVASFANSEFSISQGMVEDLTALGSKMDRVFLVFNKIDKLKEDQLRRLQDYINKQLEDYGILKFLPCPPMYVSADKSFRSRIGKEKEEDSVAEVEKRIWEYLLSQNKTGLHKILSGFASSKTLISRYRNLVNIRLKEAVKREATEQEITVVKKGIDNLRKLVAQERLNNFEMLKNYTANSFQNILGHLERELNNMNYEEFPTKEKISDYLENYAFQVISDVNDLAQQKVYELQSKVNQWIVEKLKQVETTLESDIDDVELQKPDVTKYTNQIFSFFQESRGGYIGIIETLFTGLLELLRTIFESIKDAFTDTEVKKSRAINSIMNKSKKAYKKIETEFLIELNKYLNTICRKLEEKSIERTNAYLSALANELSKYDIKPTPKQLQCFEQFITSINNIEGEIDSLFTELEDYTTSIDWIKHGIPAGAA